MDKYQDYLAAEVLHENHVVSYRTLSRALKVHVDLAKQMLFEFHRKQTVKKPGCVHATYLLNGFKFPAPRPQSNGTQTQDGEDSIMQSSPYMSSQPDNSGPQEEENIRPVRTVTLVQEAELEEVKAQFEDLLSIQIYSLQPSPTKDLNLLVTCNQEVAAKYSAEDPLERWETYGSIRNEHAKRRTLRKGPITPAATTAPTKTRAAATIPAPSTSTAAPRQQSGAHAGSVGTLTSKPVPGVASSPKPEAKKPALKTQSSDLFKSFAKTKAKPQKAEAAPEPDSVDQDATEDEPMEDASDGENEAQAAEKRKVTEEERRKQAAREADLRKMMETDDDEVMADAAEPEDEDEEEEEEEEKEEVMEPEPSPPPKPKEPEKAEEGVTVSDGRRRGRRRVTKKKTVKDDEGYLVTKEEIVWESFSEDEVVPKKPKSTPAASTAAKGKKGGKPGQGSIMNFFQKK